MRLASAPFPQGVPDPYVRRITPLTAQGCSGCQGPLQGFPQVLSAPSAHTPALSPRLQPAQLGQPGQPAHLQGRGPPGSPGKVAEALPHVGGSSGHVHTVGQIVSPRTGPGMPPPSPRGQRGAEPAAEARGEDAGRQRGIQDRQTAHGVAQPRANPGGLPQQFLQQPALAQSHANRISSRVTIGSCTHAHSGTQPWSQAQSFQTQQTQLAQPQQTMQQLLQQQQQQHQQSQSQQQQQQQAPGVAPHPQDSPAQAIRRLQSLPPSWFPGHQMQLGGPLGLGASAPGGEVHIATLEEEHDEREEPADSARVKALMAELADVRRERDELRRERDALMDAMQEELRSGRVQSSAEHGWAHVGLEASTMAAAAAPATQPSEEVVEVFVSVPRAFTDAELQEVAEVSARHNARGSIPAAMPAGNAHMAGRLGALFRGGGLAG